MRMMTPRDKVVVTTTATLLGTLPGDPPRVLISKRLRRGGNLGRLFQQAGPVPDADLFARLIAQAGTGDTLPVTVTTEWYEDSYTTYLSAFELALSPVAGGSE
jgi:hypothetical protein